MKITLSKHAGFCDGVSRAFNIAEKTARDRKAKKPIVVLGLLVHNNDVIRKIETLGIRRIDLKDLKKAKPGQFGTVLFTAHGVGPEVYDLARKKKVDLVDTTCPRVIKVQRLANIYSKKNHQVVIVGEKDHKEIQGIFGWTGKKAKIIENKKELEKLKLDSRRPIAVISQTTQNQDFLDFVNRYIQRKYPRAEIVPTICLATQNRQGEVKELARKNEVVIVIGSPESANSTRLFEIAREINSHSYFIERAVQLKKSWFKNVKKVGITAGASTPNWIIKDVMKKLKSF